MNTLFLILFIVSLIALILGLIRPKTFSAKMTRKKTTTLFGLATLVFIILLGVTSDTSNDDNQVAQQVKQAADLDESPMPTESEFAQTPKATNSQKNALRSAKNYLKFTAFSRDGLIDQLKFEQFSHEDAVYGADNSDADWRKQAVEKAKSYLEFTAFSRDGLVDQLKFDQFSHDDAVYGTDNSGADWNEQAVKKAKSYLEFSAFSRNSLIDQLKFEQFTQGQAEYGATGAGL